MGTRAIITFTDDNDKYHVYQHWDGDPETVKANIQSALKLAWPLPRFEPDEFAAAYIAANKTSEGNIRVSNVGPEKYGDLSYSYVVTCEGSKLHVKTSRG